MDAIDLGEAIRRAEEIRLRREWPGELDRSPAADADRDKRLVADLVHRPVGRGAPLTVREAQVMLLVAEGLTNEEIGGELNIAYETVKYHLKYAMGKMGARNRAHAAAMVARRQAAAILNRSPGFDPRDDGGS